MLEAATHNEIGSKRQDGSVAHLLRISIPLMLSALSSMITLFTDRIFLASYSVDSLTAATATGNLSFTFIIAGIALASISEVFVGQYNGAKQYHDAPKAVWQMIFFSILAGVIYIAIAIFASEHLVPKTLGMEGLRYFQILLSTGGLFTLQAALAGFFAGTERASIITYSAIIANVLNIIFDYLLIFGFYNIIPEMGILGAGIATVISQLAQQAYLLYYFLNKDSHQKYRTREVCVDLTIFKKCLAIGFPSALSHVLEMAAWATIYHIASQCVDHRLLVMTVTINIGNLFFFLTQGLEKGVIAAGANFIGEQKSYMLTKLIRSALSIVFGAATLIAIPLLLSPESLIKIFITKVVPSDYYFIFNQVSLSLKFLWLFMIIDGIAWALAAILTAAGDTFYVMMVNIISIWGFGVLPITYIITQTNLEPYYINAATLIYASCNVILFMLRLSFGNWNKQLITTKSNDLDSSLNI